MTDCSPETEYTREEWLAWAKECEEIIKNDGCDPSEMRKANATLFALRSCAAQSQDRMNRARALYLAVYESQGADWNANDCKELWATKADRYLELCGQKALSSNAGQLREALLLASQCLDSSQPDIAHVRHQIRDALAGNAGAVEADPVAWIVLSHDQQNVRIWWRRKDLADE